MCRDSWGGVGRIVRILVGIPIIIRIPSPVIFVGFIVGILVGIFVGILPRAAPAPLGPPNNLCLPGDSKLPQGGSPIIKVLESLGRLSLLGGPRGAGAPLGKSLEESLKNP